MFFSLFFEIFGIFGFSGVGSGTPFWGGCFGGVGFGGGPEGVNFRGFPGNPGNPEIAIRQQLDKRNPVTCYEVERLPIREKS